jgi:hypothetical protein
MDSRRYFLKALTFGGLISLSFRTSKGDRQAKLCLETPGLPWTRRRIREDAPETFQRFLRRSPETGTAVIVFFPPGWCTEQLVYYDSDEAIFVLEGDFTVGNQNLGPGQYCYMPRRMIRKHISSRQGAVVLAFFSRISGHFSADPLHSDEANEGLEVVDTWSHPWQIMQNPGSHGLSGTLLLKFLRNEAGDASRTCLVNLAPGFAIRGAATASGWQEWFLLSGCLMLGRERCVPGAYGYLPAGASGGPACTETGALLLVRVERSFEMQFVPTEEGRKFVDDYLAKAAYSRRPDY